MAKPQCCYLAKGAKRPSHTTNMQTFQLSLFTFGTQLSAFGKFVKVICLGLNCRGTQLTLFAFGTQFVLGLNRCLTLSHTSVKASKVEEYQVYHQFLFLSYFGGFTVLRNSQNLSAFQTKFPSRGFVLSQN